MVIKVLLLNFPRENLKSPENIQIIHSDEIEVPFTLHDFHVVMIDTSEIKQRKWALTKRSVYPSYEELHHQLLTGGLIFFFCGPFEGEKYGSNYDTLHPDILNLLKFQKGDTFYSQDMKYYAPLLRKIPKDQIKWFCYFEKLPKNSTVVGTNRAGYGVFTEIQVGLGKLIMLPEFKDKVTATNIILNEIIPQIITEEETVFTPRWVSDFSSQTEQQIRMTLKEYGEAKKLLYAKSKDLKKAVANAFQKFNFKVEILPDGTLPDLRISDNRRTAMVEVKGHENRQANRDEVLQLMGYITEEKDVNKGVFVCNHEIHEEPSKRKIEAFTEGAIKLGNNNEVSLVSTWDLYKVVVKIIENKLEDAEIKKIRDKIITGIGIVKLST